MAVAEISVAAATAVVGYDLMQDNQVQTSAQARTLVSIGLAGSAAALDTKVEVKVGTTSFGELYNAATGAVLRDHIRRVGAPVPPNVPVHLYVTDAPGTNPINASLDFA